MKPTELMKACGSKKGSFEPESRDQWRWLLANAEGPERVLAWVRLKSIAHRSPFCIDEAGQALTIESVAADLGLTLKTAQNQCYALVSQGRIRTQRGRIYYRADVPDSTEAKTDSEATQEGDDFDFVQSHFPTYLHDSIRRLSAPKFARLKACAQWTDKVLAETIAAARSIVDQVQDTTLRELGLEKKRLDKGERGGPTLVRVELCQPPDFVQSHSVQTQNGSVQNVVRNGASLLPSDPDSDSRREAAATASGALGKAAAGHVVPLADVNAVAERCRELGLQIPDRPLIVKLLTLHRGLPPKVWPLFPDQKSPGLWLLKTYADMTNEFERQQAGPKPKSTANYERLVARAKEATGGAGGAS